MEKYLDWDTIADAKQIDNQLDEYMMTLDTVATFCENQVVPRAEQIDKEKCHLEKGPGMGCHQRDWLGRPCAQSSVCCPLR